MIMELYNIYNLQVLIDNKVIQDQYMVFNGDIMELNIKIFNQIIKDKEQINYKM